MKKNNVGGPKSVISSKSKDSAMKGARPQTSTYRQGQASLKSKQIFNRHRMIDALDKIDPNDLDKINKILGIENE